MASHYTSAVILLQLRVSIRGAEKRTSQDNNNEDDGKKSRLHYRHQQGHWPSGVQGQRLSGRPFLRRTVAGRGWRPEGLFVRCRSRQVAAVHVHFIVERCWVAVRCERYERHGRLQHVALRGQLEVRADAGLRQEFEDEGCERRDSLRLSLRIGSGEWDTVVSIRVSRGTDGFK